MIAGLLAISSIVAISGAASTPLSTALQYSALIGSRPTKFSARPTKVDTAITP